MATLATTFPGPLSLVLAVGLFWLAFAYVRRARAEPGPARGTDALFALAWALAALALLWPSALRPAASEAVAETGVPEFLREADDRIEAVEELPQTLWDELRGPLGWALDETSPVAPIPLRGGRALELRVVPAIESWVAGWLRVAALFVASAGLAVAWLLRRTLGLRRRLRRLEARVARLEAEGAAPVESGEPDELPPQHE